VLSNVYVADTDQFVNYEANVTDRFSYASLEWQEQIESHDFVPAAA
jgi:hypothetical protein